METLDTFITIASETQGLYREKGSKFLSFAYPVQNEEEVKEKVDMLRKKYFDARHHCYAYRLGADGERYRANDDGEPVHSAGKPILGQLIARGVTNVLVVVVRYFGGILLGTGGLVQAYKLATVHALENAEIITDVVKEFYRLTFDYKDMNRALKILKDLDVDCFKQDFSMYDEAPDHFNCIMNVKVRKSKADQMKKRLESVESMSITTSA